MSINPFSSAVLATLYIVCVASIIYWGPKVVGPIDTVLAPIAFLSLFVFSAAVMGFLFLSQPIQLYLDGEKKKAMNQFLVSVGLFGGITAALLIALFVVSTT